VTGHDEVTDVNDTKGADVTVKARVIDANSVTRTP
jgi:hypothetical protein